MKRIICLLSLILLLSPLKPAYSESETVFKGRPALKISEGGSSRLPESLTNDKAINLECVISRISNNYYWASRENTPLGRVESGAFVTFVAVNGSGYVRIIKPEMKKAASLMSETEDLYDYVEHLLIGLRSVTYYGKSK